MIPLGLRLRKERHRQIASAQDMIIEELYKHFDKAVIHGGTAIWKFGFEYYKDGSLYLPYWKRD